MSGVRLIGLSYDGGLIIKAQWEEHKKDSMIKKGIMRKFFKTEFSDNPPTLDFMLKTNLIVVDDLKKKIVESLEDTELIINKDYKLEVY